MNEILTKPQAIVVSVMDFAAHCGDFLVKAAAVLTGWIAVHRKIQGNFLWKKRRVFSKAEAWLDILMEVRHDEKQDKVMLGNVIVTCDRGQSIKSIETWAKRWTWTRSAVQRFLKLLKQEKMIKTENLVKTIRITVCNYETYQNKRIGPESDLNRTRTGPDLDPDTDNNDNNENNGNNDIAYTLQQVSDTGFLIGFSDEQCKIYFDHYNAQGWLLGGGLPITDLSSAMTRWRNNSYKFEAKKKKEGDKQKSTAELTADVEKFF